MSSGVTTCRCAGARAGRRRGNRTLVTAPTADSVPTFSRSSAPRAGHEQAESLRRECAPHERHGRSSGDGGVPVATVDQRSGGGQPERSSRRAGRTKAAGNHPGADFVSTGIQPAKSASRVEKETRPRYEAGFTRTVGGGGHGVHGCMARMASDSVTGVRMRNKRPRLIVVRSFEFAEAADQRFSGAATAEESVRQKHLPPALPRVNSPSAATGC